MALRALLFSADGESTSTLCHVLTGLGIEAEICVDLLVAVERATKGGYDAIVVDWDQQDDTIFFLRARREVKPATPALTLALVHSDPDVGSALQAGANSVIRKPVNQQQAHDTLSTAKDLILSQHNEQKQKEERLAATQDAETKADRAAPEYVPERAPEEAIAPKSGFLSQSAPRSALEAEEAAREQDPTAWEERHQGPQPEPSPPPPRESTKPVSLLTWQQLQERKAAAGPAPPEKPEPVKDPAPEPRSQDATEVFSSYIEAQDTDAQPAPASRRTFGIVTVTAAVLIAGGLYAWVPGHPHRVLWRIHGMITGELGSTIPGAPAAAPSADAATKPAQAEAKAPDPPDPFAGIVSDTNADNVHVIETKAIPVAGAQQPPPPAPPPFLAQGQTPPRTEQTPVATVPSSESQTAPAESPQPEAEPAAAPVSVQPSQAPAAPPAETAPLPFPAAERPSTAGRAGVVIPDSLRTGPPTAPASSLEPVLVPEETSRGWVLHSVDPVYPPQAIQQRLEGPVVLQVWVGKDGLIRDLKLVRGYFVLGRAAVEAVRQWRFKPYSVNSKPAMDFQTYITINFKLPS